MSEPGDQAFRPSSNLGTQLDEATAPRLSWPLKPFLLGWGLAATAALLVRFGGQLLLTDPCQGHTILALLTPLLLGPGGLALTASSWNDRPKAMFGLGLVMASFLPTLLLSAYDIGQLRNIGCAGGYLIVSEPGGDQISEMTLAAGQSRQFQGRIGGYQAQSHPGNFNLSAQSMSDSLVITLPKTVVQAGEVFPITVTAREDAPSNRFDWGVLAQYQPVPGQGPQEQGIETSSKVAVTIILDRNGQ
ncbi:hypothetical protein [Deinococcus radiophilus]|uniref:hypothetical protein n=1 Tax=Deinococcus radiophilus TaxID=32062 RepID=UPI001B879619|nr:hypothetical protein [Deinococcus radiophilus]UFA49430.1 hypothetical protein LMT64_05810 [Deinococcus radiophilus]